MTDHPVLIPTTLGPVGAVVSVPDRPPRATVVLLEGLRGRRYGPNRLWAHTARDMTAAGFAALRIDRPAPAPGWGAADITNASREAVRWFRARIGPSDLLVAASCYAARLGAALVAEEPRPAGLALIAPYLRSGGSATGARVRRVAIRRLHLRLSPPRDRTLERAIQAALARAPVRAIIGEREAWRGDLDRLVRDTRAGDRRLEVEVVPEISLHGFRTPSAQGETRARVTRWAEERLAALSEVSS